jgi:MerR family transcriptional regulator, light-induced transcriptional regulator
MKGWTAMMRIGELSRRTGVSPELLRAWEQRYGLLHPTRSSGGFRLYSAEDEARVRRTAALIADGLSAAEAARLAVDSSSNAGTGAPTDQPLVDDLAAELRVVLDRFDTTGGHAVLDRLLAAVSVELAVREVLIPYLHDLGARWASGDATVAQEHFASNLIRGRLLALVRDWTGITGGRSAVLAAVPGEAHDLGLVLLGVLIARRGWRVTFLGADTPLESLGAGVRDLRPSLVVLATYDARLFHQHADAIAALTAVAPVAVTAPVEDRQVSGTGAEALPDDIMEAAAALAVRA